MGLRSKSILSAVFGAFLTTTLGSANAASPVSNSKIIFDDGQPGIVENVHWRSYRHTHRKKKKKQRTAKKRRSNPAWLQAKGGKQPVQLFVSIPQQKLTVYQGDKILATSRISSGKAGHATPAGVFSILHKRRHHRSNIYSGAPMPYMQRLTWSGIALHESRSVPNRPASHGCIRLPNGFASQLFKFTNDGIHVVVANEDTKPYPISHRSLPNSSSEPVQLASASADAGESAIQKSAPIRMLVTRWTGWHRTFEIQTVMARINYFSGDIDGYLGPQTNAAVDRFRRSQGMEEGKGMTDDFVRRLYFVAGLQPPLNGRLHIRRNFKRIYEAPVAIAPDSNGEQSSLGTHMLTAMHFEPGADNVAWRGVTLTKGTGRYGRNEKGVSTASQALDRIIIPATVRKDIERLLTPGSSLAISNRGISRETMPEGSDFVLLMQ